MIANMKQNEVTVAQAKARLPELLRRIELTGERIVIIRRSKPIAQIIPVAEETAQPKEDWITTAWGLLADAPEVSEAIDEIYRNRQNHTPR